ncbi:helix-turn-helix domain-containing protein [Lysinibacillus fusiformis]|uniref:helix-turn-helix domain-containing protein n=1 Tax=Lysinibacillus fusiformis TaxID=28031 RepID=UPI002D78093F|nr:helix-turn-helix domain-containing protein [Lysinibacillus fusiformis]WRS97514.1 helix-turn-helix domain-containing protein [Lysinibacillus fusiformis]
MNFGERLRFLRKELDYSLRKMADELEISFSALGKYERNEHQPDFDTLEKLADYFDVSIDWLLARTDLRTYDELVFYDDVNHLAEKLTTLDSKKRKLIVNIIDQLYLIINSSIDDDRSLVIMKKIIDQLFFMQNGLENYKFEKLLDINNPVSVLDFMSNHKNEMNNLLDAFLKIHLEKIAERKQKPIPPQENDDNLI